MAASLFRALDFIRLPLNALFKEKKPTATELYIRVAPRAKRRIYPPYVGLNAPHPLTQCSRMIDVLIVDDHAVMRELLRQIIETLTSILPEMPDMVKMPSA